MKLRKAGEKIEINIADMVRENGAALVAAQVRDAEDRINAEHAAVAAPPNSPAARAAAKAAKDSSAMIRNAAIVAEDKIAKSAGRYDGVVLEVEHKGYAERQRIRIEAQRVELANDREIAGLKAEHDAEVWPELHAGKVETPDMLARSLGYMRSTLVDNVRKLSGVEPILTDPEAIADVLMGWGLADMTIMRIADANAPTAAQVF